MSKKNYIVDSKEMARLEKVNERVNFLKARIEKDLAELEEIKRNDTIFLNKINIIMAFTVVKLFK